MNNSTIQARSKEVPCSICGKVVRARGLKSHIRLFHKLKVVETMTQVTPPVTQVTLPVTQVALELDGVTQVNEDSSQVMVTTEVIQKITTYQLHSSYSCDDCPNTAGKYVYNIQADDSPLYGRRLCGDCKEKAVIQHYGAGGAVDARRPVKKPLPDVEEYDVEPRNQWIELKIAEINKTRKKSD